MSRKQKILVADESITIQKLVHLTFAGTSFEIVVSSDGHDAVTKSKSLKPDFVLVDSHLRSLDGFQVCESIRKESSLAKSRVILLRSSSDKTAAKKASEAGADEVLTKPFDSKTLNQIIQKLNQDEESTVIKKDVKAEKKLEAIASEVARESETNLEEEPTRKSEAKEEATEVTRTSPFKQRVEEEMTTKVELSPHLAETKIKEWIDQNLPSIAEKLIKEEIAKIVSSK